jgi:hypothetical protein
MPAPARTRRASAHKTGPSTTTAERDEGEKRVREVSEGEREGDGGRPLDLSSVTARGEETSERKP